MATTTRSLYEGTRKRNYPQVVAGQILEYLGIEPPVTDWPRVPEYWKRYPSWVMPQEFEGAASLDKQLNVLGTLLGTPIPSGTNAREVRRYLDYVAWPMIGGKPGRRHFKADRLNRIARKRAGLGDLSRRRYDKLFRLIARLDGYSDELFAQQQMARLAQVAKVGLALEIPWDSFKRTKYTAAFCAYYVANLGRRSLFTSGKQARALDAAADWLLAQCDKDPETGWLAIAYVFPRADVLAHLTLDERAGLLETAGSLLTETAGLLKATAEKNDLQLDTMVVKRGNDSSTWNALAGAWNKARDLWLALAWSLDPAIADAVLPGKALRLMAADVAAWHRRSGGGLDPDTRVWARLPRPWDVFGGDATSTRADVIAACEAESVDPAKTGWAKPRPRTQVDAIRDTPQLVHGVVVTHPALAQILRKAGYFAGPSKDAGFKGAVPGVEVDRDEHGFAVGVGVTHDDATASVNEQFAADLAAQADR